MTRGGGLAGFWVLWFSRVRMDSSFRWNDGVGGMQDGDFFGIIPRDLPFRAGDTMEMDRRDRTAPHRTAPHRTAPHRTAPHRTAPLNSF